MKYKIFSFDILDTCLCRSCGEPYAVFDLLAREVIGPNLTPTQLADFRYIRTRGEVLARQKCIAEEVTIAQIYQECDFSGLTSLSNEKLIEREILIEKEVLRPIYKTLKKIKWLHSHGQSVVYISDMYLSSEFFISVLRGFGFWENNDKIYVSCEIGQTKTTGNLFRYIAMEMNTSYKNWQHYGDNRYSDYKVPKELGICAHCCHFDYSYFQNFLRRKDFYPAESYMARVAGISRSLIIGEEFTKRLQFAADIIAPIYVAFTYNVLKSAMDRGVKKLFFLARDAYVIYRVAKEMSSAFPELEIKYLYISRKALYLPSLDSLTTESLKTILPPYKSKYDDEYFDNFQVEVKDFSIKEFEEHGVPSSLLETIRLRWKEQRNNIIEYFKQEGLADNTSSVGIVDIRGSRRSQQYINKILSDNGYKKAFGFYLEVDMYRIIPKSPDEYSAYYFTDYNTSPNYSNMSLNNILFEKYFCISNDKRTCGYIKKEDGYIIPEFEEGENLPDYFGEIQKCHIAVCLNFCRCFMINKLGFYAKEILNNALSLISEIGSSPRKEYIEVLEDVEFTESKYHGRKIVKKMMPSDFAKRNFMWLRGSLLITSPLLLTLYDLYLKVRCYYKNN